MTEAFRIGIELAIEILGMVLNGIYSLISMPETGFVTAAIVIIGAVWGVIKFKKGGKRK